MSIEEGSVSCLLDIYNCPMCEGCFCDRLDFFTHLKRYHRYELITDDLEERTVQAADDSLERRRDATRKLVLNTFGLSVWPMLQQCICPDLMVCKNYALRGDNEFNYRVVKKILEKLPKATLGDVTNLKNILLSNRLMKEHLVDMGIYELNPTIQSFSNHSVGTVFEALFYKCVIAREAQADFFVECWFNCYGYDFLKSSSHPYALNYDASVERLILQEKTSWIKSNRGMVFLNRSDHDK
jgi:hypothetical protein